MYEVFIDNKKILLTDCIQNFNNSYASVVESRNLSFDSYADLLKILPSSPIIFVLCENVENYWRQFIKAFEGIEAAGGIVECENSFLAIFRNEKWDLPKGKLEKNEDPVLGAMREIEEECGVQNLQFVKPLRVTFHTYEYKGKPVLKKTFWFQFLLTEKQRLTPQIEEGITQAVWLNKENISAFLNNTFTSITEVLKNHGMCSQIL
jgi:8-oxo-dGTP pyrophosphatase MutT (NUDIX family)